MATNQDQWIKACISSRATVKDAVLSLNKSGLRIVLIVDEYHRLVGTVSDGDIRRFILESLELETPITPILNTSPVVSAPSDSNQYIQKLMLKTNIQQVPVVDENGVLCGLHIWSDLITRRKLPNRMIIMAGGKGTRLYPYTLNCPKPMLKVNGKPILEHILQRAIKFGISDFIFTTNYLGDQIKSYFGNGSRYNVKIEYINEIEPLGTAGALQLVDFVEDETVLLSNGDVLTELDYSSLLEFHNNEASLLSIAVRMFEFQNPFGVLEIQQNSVLGYSEKPAIRSYVNAGIYAISPGIEKYFPKEGKFDMSDLIENLLAAKIQISAYPIHEEWLDIGNQESLLLANRDWVGEDEHD